MTEVLICILVPWQWIHWVRNMKWCIIWSKLIRCTCCEVSSPLNLWGCNSRPTRQSSSEYNRFVVRKTGVTNFIVQGRKAMSKSQIQSMSLDMCGTLRSVKVTESVNLQKTLGSVSLEQQTWILNHPVKGFYQIVLPYHPKSLQPNLETKYLIVEVYRLST